jgi:ribosomal protein L18
LNITVQIFQSDGTTPLTAQHTVSGALSTELTSYAVSLGLLGRQELAQWRDPRLVVFRHNSCIQIVELSSTIDYLVPAPPSPGDSK